MASALFSLGSAPTMACTNACASFSPFAPYVDNEGEGSPPWVADVLPSLSSLNDPEDALASFTRCRCNHRHINADLTEPSIGEDYVETGALGTRVPAWDLLFVLGALPDVAQPPTERITDVIVPLPYTTTDVALGRVFPTVMPMNCPTDGAVAACMLTYTSGALKLIDPKLSPNGGPEISAIGPRRSFLHDEVGTRFGS